MVIVDLEGVQVFKDASFHLQWCSKLLDDHGFLVGPEEYSRAFQAQYDLYSVGKFSSDGQFYKLVLDSLGVPFNVRLAQQLHSIYYQSFGEYPQAHDAIISLYRKYPLFLLSNLVNHWAEFILDKFKFKGFYQYQIISQSAGARKPDPGIYKMALRLSSMKPEDCVFFDDKPEDVETAKSLGMDSRRVDPAQGLTLEDVADL